VESLVDDLTYRVRSNMGPAVFKQMPRRSFIIARLVAVGDEWMLSGPVQILRGSERGIAFQLALNMSLRTPEAVFRNPDKMALAWEHQRADRARFVEFFGTELLVVPGEQTQERLDGCYTYCRDAVLGPDPKDVPAAVSMSLPLDLTDAETVALIYDETDGLGFYGSSASWRKRSRTPACCDAAGGASRHCPISMTTAWSRWSCTGWLLGIPRRRVSCSGGC
jgi:hypothetical protein